MMDGLRIRVRHLVARPDRGRDGRISTVSFVWGMTDAVLPRLDRGGFAEGCGSLPERALRGPDGPWRPFAGSDGRPLDAEAFVRLLREGGPVLPPPEMARSPLDGAFLPGAAPADHAADLVPDRWLEPARRSVRSYVSARLALIGGMAHVRMAQPCLSGVDWGIPGWDPPREGGGIDATGIEHADAHADYVAAVAGPERGRAFAEMARRCIDRDGYGAQAPSRPLDDWLLLSVRELVGFACRAGARARRGGLVPGGVSPGRIEGLSESWGLLRFGAIGREALPDAVEDARSLLAALCEARPSLAREARPRLAYVDAVLRPALGRRPGAPDDDALAGLAP